MSALSDFVNGQVVLIFFQDLVDVLGMFNGGIQYLVGVNLPSPKRTTDASPVNGHQMHPIINEPFVRLRSC